MKSRLFLYPLLLQCLTCYVFSNNTFLTSLEDKTKAVFIYHFTKFIRWPLPDSSAPFKITILGKTNIEPPLKEIQQKKTVYGHKIQISQKDTLEDTLDCQILFVTKSQKQNIGKIVKKTAGRPILTIGDTKGFAELGVAINFFMSKGKIKFEINSAILDSTQLSVSSQLLKLARFVQGK